MTVRVSRALVIAAAGTLFVVGAGAARAQLPVGPSCDPPRISGTARDGASLTATRGSCSEVPSPTVTLQWFLCDTQLDPQSCVARTGQIRSSSLAYSVTAADVNRRLVVQQVARNDLGRDQDETATDVVAAVPPSATPTISGVAQVGEELAGSEGFLSGTNPTLVGVQWARCEADGGGCAAIDRASQDRYQLTPEDAGKTIRFQVTVKGPQHTVNVLSPPTAVVQGTTPVGTEPGAAPEVPVPKTPARPTLLKPFPTIVIAGRAFTGRAVVSTLLVRGPSGARVSVTCRGRGCPVRRQRRTIRGRALRLHRFETGLMPGTVIEIRVTSAERIGKFTRLRILRGRVPARTDLCLKPGRRRPISCPGGVG